MYKRQDWNGFREELEQRIALNNSQITTVKFDMDVEQLINDIQQATTPQLKIKTPWLNHPKEIKELVPKKREACKKI